jgi:hypothetical protein
MTEQDPEVEVATPLSPDSSARLADVICTVLREDGGPIVQDLLDSGASVESASVYSDAIYATFLVDEGDYRQVQVVDRTDGEGEQTDS